ncbi:MAG: hypothetical protein M1818_000511 [Claussenomyces sp. TS43310]|nr:MAG: hypothetical protein M1818_000511 [Claussenomyces sp. TS43310]
MWRCHEKYGNYVRYAPNRVLINTNTGLKKIYSYSNTIQKSQVYNVMVHRAPNTLTLIDKKGHGRKRRIISQGFSEAAVRGYEPTILNHIRTFCDQLAPDSKASEDCKDSLKPSKWSTRDLAPWTTYLTFDIMTDVIFGEKYKLLETPQNREVVQSIDDSNVRTGVLLQAAELATCRFDRRLFPKAIIGRNAFIKFVNALLKRRMQAQPLKRKDVFSFLLDAKDPETQQGLATAEIGAESTTMIVAGSDTSSTALASTFFYLCHNPEAYAKAAAEVRSTFAGHEDVHVGPALNSCHYLRACIDESMRMSPPTGSSLWREVCAGGVTIDGYHIPGGYDVGTGIYAIHHNPEYYPEPFLYRPERWLDDPSASGKSEAVSTAQSAFTPFSIGPRGCIGKGLAMTELMLAMAYALSRFEFKGVDKDIGAGSPGADDGRRRENEYQLFDHVTAAKKGPLVQFRER